MRWSKQPRAPTPRGILVHVGDGPSETRRDQGRRRWRGAAAGSWAILGTAGRVGAPDPGSDAPVDRGAVRQALEPVSMCACVSCDRLRRSGPRPPYHEGSKRPTPHNPLHIYSCGYCKGGAESKRAATKRTSVSFGLSTCRLLCQDYQALIDLGWRRSGTCGVDLRPPLRIGLSDRVHPSIN